MTGKDRKPVPSIRKSPDALLFYSKTKSINKDKPMSNDPKKQDHEPNKQDHDWTDEIQVAGSELVERIKKLVADGNVRRLIIRKPNGESLLEIPLTAGVAVGGTVTILAPVLAAIGALAALLAEFKVEVVRTDGADKGED